MNAIGWGQTLRVTENHASTQAEGQGRERSPIRYTCLAELG
jgi:hypothetical protein